MGTWFIRGGKVSGRWGLGSVDTVNHLLCPYGHVARRLFFFPFKQLLAAVVPTDTHSLSAFLAPWVTPASEEGERKEGITVVLHPHPLSSHRCRTFFFPSFFFFSSSPFHSFRLALLARTTLTLRLPQLSGNEKKWDAMTPPVTTLRVTGHPMSRW